MNARPPNQTVLPLLLILLILAGIGTPVFAKKNVLFLISDDLTAEALSCYGNQDCKTPNIDALAQSGMRFDRAYCQFPVCGPSRAVVMSGLYPQAIGVTGNGSAKHFEKNMGARPSLPQHFRNHGYHAARVGKIYHMRVPGDITAGVDGPDHPPSWTEKHNCKGPEWMSTGTSRMSSNEKLNRDPDKHYGLGFGTAFYTVEADGSEGPQPDTMAAKRAIEILRRQSATKKPFFLAVGFIRPHVPLVAPAPFFKQYPTDSVSVPEQFRDDWSDIPRSGISRNGVATGLDAVPGRRRQVIADYYAAVTYMDSEVGRILAELDRLKIREETIVIFTSDHGYHLGEHDFWQKMSLHEESTRIPLIVDVPDKSPGITKSMAAQIDLYPTLVELAGLPVPTHCQGHSLVPVFDDPEAIIRPYAYCLRGRDHSLRITNWAYMLYRDGSEELYDMRSDPKQFHNLAGKEHHKATKKQLGKTLKRHLSTFGAPLFKIE